MKRIGIALLATAVVLACNLLIVREGKADRQIALRDAYLKGTIDGRDVTWWIFTNNFTSDDLVEAHRQANFLADKKYEEFLRSIK